MSRTVPRRILADVQEAARRAGQVARGLAGTPRVGFVDGISWHGIVPECFRRFLQKQAGAELIPVPMLSLAQVEAVRMGRLDAGFIVRMAALGADLEQRSVSVHNLVLAAPKGHPVTRQKRLHLGDLREVPFVCFPRRANPPAYDQLMEACYRGGLTSPRIVQEADDHATILSLVACRLGVALVSDSARWQCPRGVALLPIVDLNLKVSFSLIWRKDSKSPLLQRLVAQVDALGRKNSGELTPSTAR